MYDILPFPNIVATSLEELQAQTNNYLIQLKETLEFILTNISVDNLSSDLINRLNEIGNKADLTKNETIEELRQTPSGNLTVSDVINSPAFKEAVPSVYVESITLTQGSGTENKEVYKILNADGSEQTISIPII